MTARVLVVDDDAAVRAALAQTLELAELLPTVAGSFIEAKDHIRPDFDGVIISDIRMPGKDGFTLLDFARSVDADLPVLLLTGEGDIPMAVRGMSQGAFDFLEKPCAPDVLLRAIKKALRTRALVLENRRLQAEVEKGDEAARLIFGSSAMAEDLRARVRRVAVTPSEVLVAGAPGTGTAKVAEVIHRLSPRAQGPFRKLAAQVVTVETLRDAIREAEGGSLFLDEIAALAPDVQYALLDCLDDTARPRVISGTYRDLESAVAESAFNHDLFYRLDVLRVRVPALKERAEDIPVLFRHYVAIACEQADLPEPEMTPALFNRLMEQDWPGNSRALMNTAMRFAMGLPEPEEDTPLGLGEQLARVEKSILAEALRQNHGNATEAAAALKLPRKTLYDRLARYDLKPETYRTGSATPGA